MVDGVGLERADDTDFIGNSACLREQLTELDAALAKTLETENRGSSGKLGLIGRHPGKTLSLTDRIREVRPSQPVQVWLVVEEIELRGGAMLEEVDYAFR